MSACPCGCSRSIRPGCKYATQQCWGRVRKQQIPKPTCATCSESLLAADVAQGCKRCKACRKASKVKAFAVKPPVVIEDSWWINPTLSREAFMARVSR